jgi:hypothetical protein
LIEPFVSDERVSFGATEETIGGARNSTKAVGGKARYLALLHDDDRWQPEFLERRIAFLDAHPTCGLVCSDSRGIDDEGRVLYRFSPPLREGLQPHETFFRTLYHTNVVSFPTVLLRRAAFEAAGGRFSSTVLFYDYELWLRIAAQFDVGYLAVCDAEYRIHPGQTTHLESPNMGGHRLQLLDAVDPFLPPFISTLERRRARSGAFLRSSVDAAKNRQAHRALHSFGRALRVHPLALVDPKLLALTIGSLRDQASKRPAWARRAGSDR